MAEYIEHEAIIRAFVECGFNLRRVKAIIHSLPSADVVEVVRCKDCKSCDFFYPVKSINEEAIGAYFCKVLERYTSPTNFCSYGERKEK